MAAVASVMWGPALVQPLGQGAALVVRGGEVLGRAEAGRVLHSFLM